MSKRLKKFLRRHKPRAHWHVAPDGNPVDLFRALTVVVEASPLDFCKMLPVADAAGGKDYPGLWNHLCTRVVTPSPDYSGLCAVKELLAGLPAGSVLHLANSSTVRLAELFPLPHGVEVHCNRGANGIEGSVSAAVGYAAASCRLNVLVTGDLSFFYDMNALWNSHVRSNLRIVLLNNGGGGIFRTLPGLEMEEKSRRFVTADHEATAEGWATSRGFVYLRATDAGSLRSALGRFFEETSASPVLLEVFTDATTDAAEVKKYYHQIKDKIH